jgi:hypothetical protein
MDNMTTRLVLPACAACAAYLCCPPCAGLQLYDVAKHGADWWAAHLFKHKTYVEARSMANPFVAFWRVYAFHAVLLTIMAALVRFKIEKGTGCRLDWGSSGFVLWFGCVICYVFTCMMVDVL